MKLGSTWLAGGDTPATIVDYVVEQARYTGTHTGTRRTPEAEIPATGKELDFPFVGVFRVDDGKIASQTASICSIRAAATRRALRRADDAPQPVLIAARSRNDI